MIGKHTPKRPRRKIERPKKPYPAFPLSPHASGKWQKKIRGAIYYFGSWARRENGKLVRIEGDGWKDALEAYKSQADDLHAGRTPRVKGDDLNVADLCNQFLTAKMRQLQAGELSPRSFSEYRQATDLIVQGFGKTRLVCDLAAGDFGRLRADMSTRWGPARLSKFIQLIRTVFKFSVDNGLIERPVVFGSAFNKPGKAVMRKHKAASDRKLFTATEVRSILDALEGVNPQLRAAVLLGVNCGLGNSDVSGLQTAHLDLSTGWLDFPREKTGLPRRVPLWRETVEAVKTAIAKRRPAKLPEDAGCVFINRAGHRMVQMTERSHQDYVSSQFRKVLRDLHINGRKGLNFYSLRHSFATIALEAGDRDAVRSLMGHAAHDMLSAYDETGPSDGRLLAVVNHVHGWLFDGVKD